MRYLDLPGEDPTGYHDRVLALLGGVCPMQYPVVEVPPYGVLPGWSSSRAHSHGPRHGRQSRLIGTWTTKHSGRFRRLMQPTL